MKDILKQPEELSKSLAYSLGPGKTALEDAAGIVNKVRHVYITGIGSSWHATRGGLPRGVGYPLCKTGLFFPDP